MNAQQIINNVEREEIKKEYLFSLFYPSLFKQIQTDKNLTKILKELKK